MSSPKVVVLGHVVWADVTYFTLLVVVWIVSFRPMSCQLVITGVRC